MEVRILLKAGGSWGFRIKGDVLLLASPACILSDKEHVGVGVQKMCSVIGSPLWARQIEEQSNFLIPLILVHSLQLLVMEI